MASVESRPTPTPRRAARRGRAAFITGQIPMRTGLTTVGMPGALQGIQAEDPTLADLLKPAGLYDAQIGKNHLGDSTGTPIHPIAVAEGRG